MLLHLVGFSSSLVTDTVFIKRRISPEIMYDMYMSYMIWYDFSELVVLRFLAMGERNYTTEQVKEYRDPPKFLALINFASNLCYHHDCKNFISSYQYQDHQKLLASLIALNPCYHQIKMLFAPKVLLEYLWPMITNPIPSHPNNTIHPTPTPHVALKTTFYVLRQKEGKTERQKDGKKER